MIVPIEVQQWYNANYPRLTTLERIVKDTLDQFCYPKKYLYTGRVKSATSLAEKLDTGSYRSWSDIDDCYAGTVVVPNYSHEPQVRSFLRTAFFEETVRARGSTKKSPDTFRFDATRVYCRLNGPSYSKEMKELLFEIQINSAFDYAWQTVTHDLVYKHSEVDWKRLRISGQMKAMVEQLDQMSENFDAVVSGVRTSAWAEVTVKSKVIAHLRQLFEAGKLPAELRPEAPSRVADCVVSYLKNDRCRNEELESRAQLAMDALDKFIAGTASAAIPRSITLGQLLFGIMYTGGIISDRVQQTIVLNAALEVVFPSLRGYTNTFNLAGDSEECLEETGSVGESFAIQPGPEAGADASSDPNS